MHSDATTSFVWPDEGYHLKMCLYAGNKIRDFIGVSAHSNGDDLKDDL